MNIPRIQNTEIEQPSPCWPKDWLSQDVSTSHIRMLAVDYESRVSEWQVQSMPRNILRRPMHDRAQEIAEQLKQAGVGKRPIIWVKKKKKTDLSFLLNLLSRLHILWAVY